jgi:hypothetical protein
LISEYPGRAASKYEFLRRRRTEMRFRADEWAFIAVLITAILLIFVARIDAVTIKVGADLAIAYWAVRSSRTRRETGR